VKICLLVSGYLHGHPDELFKCCFLFFLLLVSALREVREAEGKRTRSRKNRVRKIKRRRNKQRNNKKPVSKMNGRAVTDTCFEQVAIVMKKWKGIVTNFGKQMNRMKNQNKTGGNKAGKKGAFGPIALRIMEAGGGNKSSLSCGGSTDNDGAKQLKNLTDTLFSCEDMIHTACDPANIPQPNITKLDMCSAMVDKFTAGAGKCLAMSTGAGKTDTTTACSCWTNATLMETVTAVSDCNFNTEAKAVAAALKNCTKAFSTCRKFEDDAITSITSCNSDATKLTQKASTLSTNAAAVKAANEKVANLTSSSSRRVMRVATTCAEILEYATKLAEVASNSPSSPMVTTYAEKITGAGSISCSASEKASLTSVQTYLTAAAGRIDSALEAVQEQIMTLTGSTASTSMLTGVSTKATRRRNFKS